MFEWSMIFFPSLLDDEISDRLARLRGQEPAKEGQREEKEVSPEDFLSKFPKITNR